VWRCRWSRCRPTCGWGAWGDWLLGRQARQQQQQQQQVSCWVCGCLPPTHPHTPPFCTRKAVGCVLYMVAGSVLQWGMCVSAAILLQRRVGCLVSCDVTSDGTACIHSRQMDLLLYCTAVRLLLAGQPPCVCTSMTHAFEHPTQPNAVYCWYCRCRFCRWRCCSCRRCWACWAGAAAAQPNQALRPPAHRGSQHD
jgi:hypothetical protein